MRDVYEHLSNFPEVKDLLTVLRREMQCMASNSPSASLVRAWACYGLHARRYLPLSLRPILENPLIEAGISVGWHRAPSAMELPADLGHLDNRLLLGQLIHVTKKYGELSWEADIRDIHTIGHLSACALTSTNFRAA